jgi:DNA (cytosine-5)-methyltransferase 1
VILDLFAGPGGWDEGARLTGYDGPLVGIEWDRDACATAAAAGHWRIRADVATYPTAPFAGKVDGLIASPPCQSFSHAGNRAGVDDERGELVWQPLRWVRDLTPRWVALEQVPDVLPIWQIIAAALRDLGYGTWTGLLNSADYGVPQTRIRAALVGRLDGVALPPAPTHAKNAGDDLFGSTLRPWVSMADALGWDEPVAYRRTRGAGLKERHGERPDTPVTAPAPTITGKSRSDVWFLGAGAASARTAGALARPASEPAHTITGKATAAWVDAQGGHTAQVSVPEAAVLQSFRPDYPFHGSKSSQHQQVGNAIPVLLAAAILRPLVADPAEEAAA